MSPYDPTVELDIAPVPNAGYGWHAMFRDRPGDTLSTGAGEPSVAACLALVSTDVPDNSLVEIRFKGVASGTWHAHELQTAAERVATELFDRVRGFFVDEPSAA